MLQSDVLVREFVPSGIKWLQEKDAEYAASLTAPASVFHRTWRLFSQWLKSGRQGTYMFGTKQLCRELREVTF